MTVELKGDVNVKDDTPVNKRVMVAIAEGRFEPDWINVNVGDAVSYVADDDSKLCIISELLYGKSEYNIAAGKSVTLLVKPTAPHYFRTIALTGDASTDPCPDFPPEPGGDEGRGGVGGGGGP